MRYSVAIAIQARSSSSRLPRKAFEHIGEKRLIEHVIDRCKELQQYVRTWGGKMNCHADVALLVPKGDPLAAAYRKAAIVIEGDENDVLGRFMKMVERLNPDYIVRVTGDCPFLPSPVIQHHIKLALANGYDYCSNVDPSCRTSWDGTDCEIISKRALEYANEKATDPYDREHVTTILRQEPASWMKCGAVLGHIYLADVKYSVDTPEDLDRAREMWMKREKARETAEAKYGKSATHFF